MKSSSLVEEMYKECIIIHQLAGAVELHPARNGFQKVAITAVEELVAILGSVIGVVQDSIVNSHVP